MGQQTAPSPRSRFAPFRGLLGSGARRARAGAAGLVLALMATALVGTAFGAGALGTSDDMSDGAAWLWNAPAGEAVRVNGNNAEIDLTAPLPDAQDSRVEITQNDDHLLLEDPDTGQVTSVDLQDLGFSGSLDLGSGDFGVVLGQQSAVVIDRAGGEIRAVDPATLQPTGASLTLEGPLIGGAFDDSETLWLGVPSQGTAVGIGVADDEATVNQTVTVASPGSDMALTVLDDGALAIDQTGGGVVSVRDGDEPRLLEAPVPMEDTAVPDRTRGDLAAVTRIDDGEVLTLLDPHSAAESADFTVGHESAGTAVPFEGRVYVPFDEEGLVRAYSPDGEELSTVTLPGAEGPLELEAREGSLFVNAPDTGVAAVVDPSGEATIVDQSEPPPGPGEVRGETDSADPEAAPQPGDPEGEGDGEGAESGPGDGTGDGSGDGEGSDVPGPPTPVSHVAGDASVTLTWPEAHSPDAPVQEYEISWQDGSTTVEGSELEAEITGLENGTAYRFDVRAANEHGTGPAAQTGEVVPDPDAPGTPGEVTAEASGSDTATVSWEEAENAEDYLVTASSDSGAEPGDVTSTGTSADVSGLEPGETYTFSVTPRASGGVGGDPATSEPLTMPETVIGAPDSVSFSVEGNSVTVTWTPVEHAEQYRITPHGDGADDLVEMTVPGEEAEGGQLSHSFQRGSGRCFSFTVLAVGPDDTPGDTGTRSDPACERVFT